MAIIQQDLFVIRDTENNLLMEGAKGQLAFDTTEHARRSLTHTHWWTAYKFERTIRLLMPNGDVECDKLNHMDEEYARQYKADWQTIDRQLADARAELSAGIHKWARDNRIEFDAERRKIKFDKQTKFAVESLVSVETKEI